jgi:hypothetical protein
VAAIRWIELKDVTDLLIVNFLVAALVHHHLLAKFEQLDGIREFHRLRALHGLSPPCDTGAPILTICERGSSN